MTRMSNVYVALPDETPGTVNKGAHTFLASSTHSLTRLTVIYA